MSESNQDHVDPNPDPEIIEKSNFPDGLRILAIDDNVVCLKIISVLLIKCRYKVTVTTKAREAIEMLRKNKDCYDLVITDVNMLEMDGFEFLEIIGIEMDMPVIMISANDDTESVMKGIKHGARDYLLKPVRLEEIKVIWQHVLRKKLLEQNKSGTGKVGKDQNPMPLKRQRDEGKEMEEETNAQSDGGAGDSSAQKKQRLVWSKELHNKFAEAIEQLGLDKAVPKKILELMDVPGLSRENVASHLQKFRKLLEKKSGKSNKESENYLHSSKTNRYMSDLTAQPYNTRGLNISNAGMTSFGNWNQTYSASLPNRRTLCQQNLLAPQVVDQMCPNMPIPVFGSVPPTQIPSQNSFPNPKFRGIRFHSHDPNPMPLGFVPYSCPPGNFNHVQVLGVGTSELPQISQPDPLAMMGPRSSHGQNEERTLVNYDGRGGETSGFPFDMRGQIVDRSTCHFNGRGEEKSITPLDMRGQIIDELTPESQFLQHHSENPDRESNGDYNNCGSPDDDLSAMFSSSAPPRL